MNLLIDNLTVIHLDTVLPADRGATLQIENHLIDRQNNINTNHIDAQSNKDLAVDLDHDPIEDLVHIHVLGVQGTEKESIAANQGHDHDLGPETGNIEDQRFLVRRVNIDEGAALESDRDLMNTGGHVQETVLVGL